MNEWYQWIENIVVERTEAVERELIAHPEAHPQFASVDKELTAMLDEAEEHPDSKATARDNLWMTYTGALAIEMYLAGARDGGACITPLSRASCRKPDLEAPSPPIWKRRARRKRHEHTFERNGRAAPGAIPSRNPCGAGADGRSLQPEVEARLQGHRPVCGFHRHSVCRLGLRLLSWRGVWRRRGTDCGRRLRHT